MTKSHQLELLDADDIPVAALERNLVELNIINQYLGGHAVVQAGVKYFIQKTKIKSILEIGSGGGDNLAAIQKRFPNLQLKGVDLKEVCTIFAKKNHQGIDFITADYKLAVAGSKPDLIFNSLFCHHFSDEQLIEMLGWMFQHSAKGFVIADLHRHWLAYYSIKLITALFSKSYLVKNDAPLSVARGFTRAEWKILMAKAGIKNYEIKWKWAFRHLIIVEHEKN